MNNGASERYFIVIQTYYLYKMQTNLQELKNPWFVVVLLCIFISLLAYWIVTVLTKISRAKTQWWKGGVIYHIYPRSFNDSNGDGNGDLRGIINKLDYLEVLGVNILYLSPIFKSPMVDNGYDITDFYDINPMFGTMDDLNDLLNVVHDKGLKLVLDFVPNHTSDQHPWFLKSRKSKKNRMRNWYIWKDPAPNGGPPNNWVSVFGGSAWTFDATTNQYYLHQFYKEQPDLNFREPEVIEAMKDVLRFWFDKGVDGFRVDAVPYLFEDENFRDEPILPDYNPKNLKYKDLKHIYTYDLDEVHPIVRGWREVCDSYKDSYRLLIGEIFSGPDIAAKYYGNSKRQEFDFPFNFTLIGLNKTITAADVHKMVTYYLSSVPPGEWPNWLLGNHDVSRIASKVEQEYLGAYQILLLSLPGTPVMYYGDEVGMTDADVEKTTEGDPRDPCRTPLPWTPTKHAGFTTGRKTWLPVWKDSKDNNIQFQQHNSTSLLNLCQKMLHLRNNTTAFKRLQFEVVHVDQSVLAYKRFDWRSVYVVVLNFGSGFWFGGLENISGIGTVMIDSTTIKAKGTRVNVKEMMLYKGHALVIKMS